MMSVSLLLFPLLIFLFYQIQACLSSTLGAGCWPGPRVAARLSLLLAEAANIGEGPVLVPANANRALGVAAHE